MDKKNIYVEYNEQIKSESVKNFSKKIFINILKQLGLIPLSKREYDEPIRTGVVIKMTHIIVNCILFYFFVYASLNKFQSPSGMYFSEYILGLLIVQLILLSFYISNNRKN